MRKASIGLVGSVILLAASIANAGSFNTLHSDQRRDLELQRRASTCAPATCAPAVCEPVQPACYPVQPVCGPIVVEEPVGVCNQVDYNLHGHEVPRFDPVGDILHLFGKIIGGTGARIKYGDVRFKDGIRQGYENQSRLLENERHMDEGKRIRGKIEYHQHPHQQYPHRRNF